MQADRQVCAACGKRIAGKTGGVAAGATAHLSPGNYAAGILWMESDHKLRSPDGLLACGYCSLRGSAAKSLHSPSLRPYQQHCDMSLQRVWLSLTIRSGEAAVAIYISKFVNDILFSHR